MNNCPLCGGSGVIEHQFTVAVPGCCGNPTRTGECCGNAVPVPEEVVEYEECQCQGTKENSV